MLEQGLGGIFSLVDVRHKPRELREELITIYRDPVEGYTSDEGLGDDEDDEVVEEAVEQEAEAEAEAEERGEEEYENEEQREAAIEYATFLQEFEDTVQDSDDLVDPRRSEYYRPPSGEGASRA